MKTYNWPAMNAQIEVATAGDEIMCNAGIRDRDGESYAETAERIRADHPDVAAELDLAETRWGEIEYTYTPEPGTAVIYVYSEHTSGAGRVYRGDMGVVDANPDLDVWGWGNETKLTAKANQDLAVTGAGRAAFNRKCARNVLEYLGVDEE